jgi:predicted nuclease of predicted toxin-antitoxin system
LQRRGIDVTTSREASLIGASDDKQLAYAWREGRVLVTHDTDFLAIASQVEQHAGIAYARKGSRSVRQVIEQLELIHDVMSIEEMQGHIEYL